MSKKVRSIAISLLIGALALSGLAYLSTQAQQGPGPGAPGARQALESFFEAMGAGDFVLLKAGGALSGTVAGDQFTIVQSPSGKPQTLTRANIAFMSFGDKSDVVGLMTGDVVSGLVQVDSLSITLPVQTQSQVVIPKAQVATAVFKINLPGEGGRQGPGGPPSGQNQQQLFKLFRSLQSQNLFALFAKSLTSYDLAVFSNRQVLSGKIVNPQIIFNSALFGKLTFKASDVASIQLAPSGISTPDFITLKTGDRLTGTVDDQNAVQFQPVALTDGQGQPMTVTFKHGDVSEIVFRLPASAFGGGKGPGFQGGPGR
jgi:hypothetical protein